MVGNPLEGQGFIFWLLMTGLFAAFLRSNWLLLLWMLSAFFIPRESTWITSIPLGLIVGAGMSDFIKMSSFDGRWTKPRLALLSLFLVYGAYLLGVNTTEHLAAKSMDYHDNRLTQEAVSAFKYLNEKLPGDADLVVSVSRDDVHEWSPYLMERTVLNMPYGAEWDVQDAQNTQSFEEGIRKNPTDIRQLVIDNFGVDQFYWMVEAGRIPEAILNSYPLFWQNDNYLIIELK
jgi:hypothetical protein